MQVASVVLGEGSSMTGGNGGAGGLGETDDPPPPQPIKTLQMNAVTIGRMTDVLQFIILFWLLINMLPIALATTQYLLF